MESNHEIQYRYRYNDTHERWFFGLPFRYGNTISKEQYDALDSDGKRLFTGYIEKPFNENEPTEDDLILDPDDFYFHEPPESE